MTDTFLKEVLTTLHSLKENQDKILELLDISLNAPKIAEKETKRKLERFPIQTIADFERVNSELKESDSFKSCLVRNYILLFLYFLLVFFSTK